MGWDDELNETYEYMYEHTIPWTSDWLPTEEDAELEDYYSQFEPVDDFSMLEKTENVTDSNAQITPSDSKD